MDDPTTRPVNNRPRLVGVPRQRPKPTTPEGVTTLHESKDWLRARLTDGEHCPCCGQMAKIYRRRIHHTIARNLIRLYQLSKDSDDGWVHVRRLRITGEQGELSKARHWGLVEESAQTRQDGGRSGHWRLTPEGVAFVRNRSRIKQYALIYDSRCLGHEGEWVTIKDALGKKFDYRELMEPR